MRRETAAAGTLLWLVSAAAYAQAPASADATGISDPSWTFAWSPLDRIADHARALPRAPELPGLLRGPQPRPGLFWGVGNPGALAFEIQERRNELALALGHDDGDYRRPMDASDVDLLRFSGSGWERVGARGAAIGRLVVDREKAGVLPFADLLEPHPSNAFVVADSSISDLRRLRARFEGAFGWSFGLWGVGAGAGLEVRDHRADRTPLPRRARVSAAGASLGVVRPLPFAGLTLGAHLRWQRQAETASVFARLRDAVIYLLDGYAEPERLLVQPPSLVFTRRLEEEAWLWGFSLGGEVAATIFVLSAERQRREDGHFSTLFSPDPAMDRWQADGWRLSGTLQRSVLDEGLSLTAHARYSTLEGDARPADLPGITFRASEDVLRGSVALRYAPEGSTWSAGLCVSALREARLRQDFLVSVHSDIESWTPGFGVELARRLGRSTRVSAGYAIGVYSAASSIPNPQSMGAVYRLLIAPELALYATESRPTRVALAVRRGFAAGSALLLAAERESVGPRDADPASPLTARGTRTMWRVSLSVLFGD